MEQTVFIYGLNDPDTGKCRYIGKADNPADRYKKHLYNANRYRTHKDSWIKSLVTAGKLPALEILREVPISGWEIWERAFIETYRERGFELTNLAEGGKGGRGMLGRTHSPETKERMSQSQVGRSLSIETKNKLRAANLGKTASLETRKILSAKALGRRHTPQAIAKISAAGKGRQGRLGKPCSAETKHKISVANKATSARRKLLLAEAAKTTDC